MPTADRVSGDHRHDRLGHATDLNVQVGDVEAPDAARGALVAGVATDPLVAARAERVGALAGEDHDAHAQILARPRERVAQLDDGLRAERVAHLGPVDRDLGDAGIARALVADVRVVAVLDPLARVAHTVSPPTLVVRGPGCSLRRR